MYNLHCIPNVFSHANVVNISKRVYEIFESFVIKFNNTSRTSVIHFVSENERKKKEADARDRQPVRVEKKERKRKGELCNEFYSLLFHLISIRFQLTFYFTITSRSSGIHINHRTVELPCNIPAAAFGFEQPRVFSREESDGIRVSSQ